MKKFFLLLTFSLSLLSSVNAGGLKGLIKDREGNVLAFVTLYVKETKTGTTGNEDGKYSISLPQGVYTVVYQFMGYETQTHTVTIGQEFTELNITMNVQSNLLQEVTITACKEDPAYTIMRKAIAMARYHTQQLNSYSARVYVKGAGRMKDYPWYMKHEMNKEGIEKGRVFISESVSDVAYKRPNIYKERVLSVRSNGKDNNTSPNGYIFGSFYAPEIGGSISPLSPRAFAYYRFSYLGSFQDRSYTIHKIQVTPKSKGDNIFNGYIYIVDGDWSIHSLDLTAGKIGISFHIKQIYAPVEDKVWMPVSSTFNIDGSVFGFKFEYHYLSTVSNYKIEMNKDLYVPKVNLIDEKADKEEVQENNKKTQKNVKDIQQRIESGKPITGKQLRKVIKEYDKKEAKENGKKDILSNYTFKQDSSRFKMKAAYWDSIRPIPLTPLEIKGYTKTDSLATVQKKKTAQDSLKNHKHIGIQPLEIITGGGCKLSKHSYFNIKMPIIGFNTVEGLNFIYRLQFFTIFQDTQKTKLSVIPALRYGFSSKQLYGKTTALLKGRFYELGAEGGRYVKQFNEASPILPFINTFTTLLLEENYMKIFQKDYIKIHYKGNILPKISFHMQAEWATRTVLQNHSNYKLIDWKNVTGYTSNNPVNTESGGEVININSHALISSIGLSAKPRLKFRIRNNIRQEVENSSPEFGLTYTKGVNAFTSNVNYDLMEANYSQTIRIGISGYLDARLNAGMFLNHKSVYFMDYKHFMGNQTFLTITDPAGGFSLLDYYKYSTKDKYFSGSIHYQFRRFLLTNILILRLMGIQEALLLNYLRTPASKNYTELGYGIDGIFRLIKIEAAAAFQNGRYSNFGIRIGIATNMRARFSED